MSRKTSTESSSVTTSEGIFLATIASKMVLGAVSLARASKREGKQETREDATAVREERQIVVDSVRRGQSCKAHETNALRGKVPSLRARRDIE